MRTTLFEKRIYRFACRFIQVAGLVLAGILLLGGLLSTCYSLDMDSQLVLTKWDNPLLTLPLTGLAFAAICLLAGLSSPKRLRLLSALTLGWCILIGLLLVLFGRTAPAADAWSVYSMADALASGDTSVIHPTESYLSYYPHQVGPMAFYELIIRLCNLLPADLHAYHFIKCLNVLAACVIILFQKKTLQLMGKSEKVQAIYLLLAGANLPFLMYTSFVYGEIPSFAAATIGFYFLAKIWKLDPAARTSIGNLPAFLPAAAGAVISLAFAVFLRKNNLIFIIAVLIVLFFTWLHTHRHALLAIALACGLLSFSILPLTQLAYESRAGVKLADGVTATSYFAMGMQESSRANGWYNGFNFNTYKDSGLDAEATNEISRAAIRERLSYFAEQPDYAAKFYLGKHLSQWADGTYASRQATLATFGGRHPLVESFYTGAASHFYIAYCNVHQNLILIGFFAFCLCALCQKKNHLPLYLGVICILGGFLFHTVWEANSRYIFLYSLLLVPYAAIGLAHLWEVLPRLWEALQEKVKAMRNRAN